MVAATKYKVTPGKLLIVAVAVLFAVFASIKMVAADQPQNLNATGGFESVDLSWHIEENDFELDDLVEFEVEWRVGGPGWANSVTLDDLDDDDGVFQYTVTAGDDNELEPGQEYEFRVTVYYDDGDEEVDFTSGTDTATPYTFPDQPAAVTATPGHEQVALSWDEPDGNGSAVSGYELRYRVEDSGFGGWVSINDLEADPQDSFTVTELENGTPYEFDVAAINEAGTGEFTRSDVVTPASDSPQALQATAGDREVTLTWNEPSLAPEEVEEYEVLYSEHGENDWQDALHDSDATTITVTDLANGQGYDFRVSAVWDEGAGTAASVANVVPFTGVPNNGDANGDGIHDADQANVTPVENPVTGTYAVLESTCDAHSSVGVGPESGNSSTDAAFEYPAGLMSFTLDCTTLGNGATATITQYFYGNYDPSLIVARKYSPSQDTYRTIPGAVAENVTIDGQQVLKVTYQVQDGSEFDEDGVANGVIVDPAGPGLNTAGAPETGLGGQAVNQPALQLLSRSE